MATHSSLIAWKIPWTEEPGGLQSMGSQRVRHNWATLHTYALYQAQFPPSPWNPLGLFFPTLVVPATWLCWFIPPLLCIKLWISSKAGPFLWLYTQSLGGSIPTTSLPWSRCCSSLYLHLLLNFNWIYSIPSWLCHWTILTDQHGAQDLSFPKEFYPPWTSPR